MVFVFLVLAHGAPPEPGALVFGDFLPTVFPLRLQLAGLGLPEVIL